MEIFTLKEWEENFDELFARVEKRAHRCCAGRW